MNTPTRTSSDARRARLRPVLLATLALAALGLAAPAHAADDCTDTAPTNPCIPGGYNSRLDCLVEWLVTPEPLRNYRGIPRNKEFCYEGDPRCDTDPDLENGLCRFTPRICINNTDPRFTRPKQTEPYCSPSDVSTFEVEQPLFRSDDPIDVANKDALEYELGFGGLGPYIVQNKKLVYAGGVNDTPNLCSNPIELTIPMNLKRNGDFRTGRKRFIIRGAAADGRIDKDLFTLYCKPSTCGDGKVQRHEACDDGNRANGDGCDQGCNVEQP
ncbi:MAG: DUF4215 domain-containing protein [Thermodesulfobacteriota bacterium]